jgi:Ca-activated chloride channel family protein
MSFFWPGFLLLLGLIPVLIGVYLWVQRRRRRYVVRYSSLSLVRVANPSQSRLRRYLPLSLFLFALVCLVTAMSRPIIITREPTDQTAIILAIDVSRSMCSTDISPNRLVAAQEAALSFIQRQESKTLIGVVAFAGFAELIQAPTTDSEVLETAVDSLMTGRRTAIGSAILRSLDTIAEIDSSVAPISTDGSSGASPTPVPRGAYTPNIIILLTDGVSNSGPMPLDAAQMAADRGVRVYTIGFGTANGSGFPSCPNQFYGGEPFSGRQQFGGGGGGFRRGIDEATLIQIAEMTGGTYHSAESAGELQKVFRSLPTYLISEHGVVEISFAFTIVGGLLALIAIVLGMLWRPLP